jgi:NADH dehydrogenase (ubiquinone) Fe-S protein 3
MNILNYKKNIKIKISKTQILNIKYGLFLMKIFPFIKIYLKNVNELYIQCLPTNLHNLIRLATFLKLHTNSQYKCLSDICAVDYPDKRYRFEVVYNLVSLQYNTRINLTIFIQDSFPLYSLTQLYNSAN